MSTTIKTQVFDACDPLVHAGDQIEIGVSQTLKDEHGTDLLFTTGSVSTVKLKVEGPQLKLEPADIVGVYPAPYSEESPDEFLPHVALARRTLPWERRGPAASSKVTNTLPWLALLLLRDSEMPKGIESLRLGDLGARDPLTQAKLKAAPGPGANNGLGLTDNKTPLTIVDVRPNVLAKILPTTTEVELLCHMKRTQDGGADRDVAIVIGNRLPYAGDGLSKPERHTAVLVSLECRNDLYPVSPARPHACLLVLHHWSFTPSMGGDFEEVMRLIRYAPNGGVLRFGNIPVKVRGGAAFSALLDADGYFLDPLPHDQPQTAVYRGPLRPLPVAGGRSKNFAVRAAPEEFAVPPAGGALDYSHAAAFEIGRLLALADGGILEDLRAIHGVPDRLPGLVVDKVPQALRKPDWVVNPQWYEEPWGAATIANDLPQRDNFTGIAAMARDWTGVVVADLASEPVATPGVISEIEIDFATPEGLAKDFSSAIAAGK